MSASARGIQTTVDPPVHLAPPLDAPQPVPGCGVCTALAKQRTEATAGGDMSKASDCNVEIRNHPHPKRRGSTS